MGLISKTLKWFTHPAYSDADPVDWLAFIVLAILAGLLWSRVIKQTLSVS